MSFRSHEICVVSIQVGGGPGLPPCYAKINQLNTGSPVEENNNAKCDGLLYCNRKQNQNMFCRCYFSIYLLCLNLGSW